MDARFVPAPWALRGESFIQLLVNPVEAVRPLLPERFAIQSWKGRTLGALMWVHYDYTPVGPYEELLYMPARVRVSGRSGYCVTHIWVDSEDSLVSGRRNWAIPKRLGVLEFTASGRAREASLREGDPIARMRFEPLPLAPPLPMHSVLFPMPLVQEREGAALFVPFGGWGLAQPVRGRFTVEDPRALPVPAEARRLPPVRLVRFWMTFSTARPLPA